MSVRRTHSAAFKAKVAFEAAKQEKTVAQLSSQFGVHANMISKWKQQMLKNLPDIFSGKHENKNKNYQN